MQTDWKLLDKYINHRSDSAFATLLARHRNLVYSVCIRELGGDAALAEDATQVVFLILADKAKSLHREVMLTGWLFRTARFTSSQLRRRKRSLESRSIALSEDAGELQMDAPDVSWSDLDSRLNDALARLGEKDRVAVLLRYFDQMSFAEMASALGQTEDAARHRVNRALEKMRRMLAAPGGVVLPAAILAALLAENAVQPAPAHSVALPHLSSLHSAIDGSSVSLHNITQGVLKAMFLKQVSLAAAVTVAVGVPLGIGIKIARAQVPLRLTTAYTPFGKLITLHSFTGLDGSAPSGITLGTDGNFYGTTAEGGANSHGTIFRLTPKGDFTTLYSFTGGSDGSAPSGILIEGKDGDFYGGSSVIFKITKSGQLTTLPMPSNAAALGPITYQQGSDGNYYRVGDPSNKGAGKLSSKGIVNTLTSRDTSLEEFRLANGTLDFIPGRELEMAFTDADKSGSRYYYGSDTSAKGDIVRSVKGGKPTTVYTFSGPDGENPAGELFESPTGESYYGETSLGGADGKGTLFKWTPTASSLAATASAASGSREVHITSVQISGNTAEPTAKLRALLPISVGQTLTYDSLSSAVAASEPKLIAAYAADGYVARIGKDLTLDPDSGVVSVSIDETTISDVSMVVLGKSMGLEPKIQNALQAQGVAKGSVYNPARLSSSLNRVADDKTLNINTIRPINVQPNGGNTVALTILVNGK